MKLTKEIMESLTAQNNPLPVRCRTFREYERVRRYAYIVKARHPREDGCTYRISCNPDTQTISVSVVKQEEL